MSAWNRICCPIDFSRVSRIAMEEAATLGSRFGGSVTLLHIETGTPLPAPEATLVPAEALHMVTLERERQLEAWRAAAERISRAPVDSALVEGDPATEIIRFVAGSRYDVIVMGTHGRSGRDKVPFGSVAQKVILDAPCPVLVMNDQGSSKPA
jgi:nucleotide-binding universal stress UspA family protein